MMTRLRKRLAGRWKQGLFIWFIIFGELVPRLQSPTMGDPVLKLLERPMNTNHGFSCVKKAIHSVNDVRLNH